MVYQLIFKTCFIFALALKDSCLTADIDDGILPAGYLIRLDVWAISVIFVALNEFSSDLSINLGFTDHNYVFCTAL